MASNAVRRRRRAKRRLMYPPLNRLFSREELSLALAGASPYLWPGEWTPLADGNSISADGMRLKPYSDDEAREVAAILDRMPPIDVSGFCD